MRDKEKHKQSIIKDSRTLGGFMNVYYRVPPNVCSLSNMQWDDRNKREALPIAKYQSKKKITRVQDLRLKKKEET